jgi:ABC-2 type transport system permease protein
MRKYWAFYKVSLQDTLAYRGPLLLWAMQNIFVVLVMTAIWLSADAVGTIGGYTKMELVNYYLLVLFVQWLVYWVPSYYVKEEIKSGEINSKTLLKPASYLWQKLAHEFAWHTVSPFIGILAVTFAFLIVRPEIIVHFSAVSLGLFLVAVLLAGLTSCFFNFCLGLLAFWLTETESINSFYWIGIFIFGGQGVPISFFPAQVQPLVQISPFRYMFSLPLEIAFGQLRGADILINFGVQIFWLLFFFTLFQLMWREGLRSYSAFGG